MNIPTDPTNPHAAADGVGPIETSGKAVTSLVLGVASLLPCVSFLSGIPAIVLGALGLRDIERSHGRMHGRGMAIGGIVTGIVGSTLVMLATIGILIALLLPAISAARMAGRRHQSANNLKQVGMALHSFHDRDGRLPAASTIDDAGNPLLSWRVAILPYLEQGVLFERFKKDEPWNGPVNQPLVNNEPPAYIAPGDGSRAAGETNVLGIVGRDTILAPGEGVNLRDVPDGLSKTIVAADLAGAGIAWTEPRDLSVEEFVAAVGRTPSEPDVRPVYPGGVMCLFGDGHVQFIPSDTPPETLRALCTRSGGEEVALPFDY